MRREYGIWRTDACDRCGNDFQVTRTQTRVVEDGEELVCSDCRIYEDAEEQSGVRVLPYEKGDAKASYAGSRRGESSSKKSKRSIED